MTVISSTSTTTYTCGSKTLDHARINLDEYRRPHKAYFKITIDFGKQILKTKLWKNDLSDVGKFNAIGEEIEKDLAKAVWIA